MGNTNISPKLKKKIREWLKDNDNRLEIPNETAFINRACLELLRKIKRDKKRYS